MLSFAVPHWNQHSFATFCVFGSCLRTLAISFASDCLDFVRFLNTDVLTAFFDRLSAYWASCCWPPCRTATAAAPTCLVRCVLQRFVVPCCCCWSLLYSAILRSRADSLHSYVILHEWTAFYSAFFNIHRSCVLTAPAWLVPCETAAISALAFYLFCDLHFTYSSVPSFA